MPSDLSLPLVTPCGYRYRLDEAYSAGTPEYCSVCRVFHSASARCPRCSELGCEACEFWSRATVLGVLRHGGAWRVERKGVGGQWPPGPWDAEPDRIRWWHAGLPCVAIRSELGCWNGYVGTTAPLPSVDLDRSSGLSVHGGVTYRGPASWPICYAHDAEGYEYVGFDCGHYQDALPGLSHFNHQAVYRDILYVMAEADLMAEQVAGLVRKNASGVAVAGTD